MCLYRVAALRVCRRRPQAGYAGVTLLAMSFLFFLLFFLVYAFHSRSLLCPNTRGSAGSVCCTYLNAYLRVCSRMRLLQKGSARDFVIQLCKRAQHRIKSSALPWSTVADKDELRYRRFSIMARDKRTRINNTPQLLFVARLSVICCASPSDVGRLIFVYYARITGREREDATPR